MLFNCVYKTKELLPLIGKEYRSDSAQCMTGNLDNDRAILPHPVTDVLKEKRLQVSYDQIPCPICLLLEEFKWRVLHKQVLYKIILGLI